MGELNRRPKYASSLVSSEPAMSAGSVAVTRPAHQRADGGASPTPALQPFGPKDIIIRPIPHLVARRICEQRHYLKSYPGGSLLNFGVFVNSSLLGVAVLGVGPSNLHCLFEAAQPQEVLCLSRLWLDDCLGRNCESRTLGVILRSLRHNQSLAKAIVAYSDPLAGHVGGIYRASGFLFVGYSSSMPLYLVGGRAYHSRSLSHSYGTHSIAHFRQHGVQVQLLPQAHKFVYVALIDPTWRERLLRPPQPYPKRGGDL
jgi:hypothetical protein